MIKDEKVAVVRGKYGTTKTISAWELVVGDVVLLGTGARVPADCLALESESLVVEEPPHAAAGGADGSEVVVPVEATVAKAAAAKGGADAPNANDPDPFLFAGSVIQQGHCRALVCCVGRASTRGIVDKALETAKNTTLQGKLKNLGDRFTSASLVMVGVIFLAVLFRLGVNIWWRDEEEYPTVGDLLLDRLPRALNLTVVLVIVSIPEGLPLTVGVSIAFSVTAMYRDRILIRRLDAPEKMGSVSEICCGKTAALTTNEMKVAHFYCQGLDVKRTRNDTLKHCDLTEETLLRIEEGMLYNCEARVEPDDLRYVASGPATEVALIRFLQDAGVPVHLRIQKKFGQILAECPFSPDTRRSAVAMRWPADPANRVAVYVKGAPELITRLCRRELSNRGSKELNASGVSKLTEKAAELAKKPLRVIAFAFAEVSASEWDAIAAYHGLREGGRGPGPQRTAGQALDAALAPGRDGKPEKLELTYLGAFGLQDPVRPKACSCIRYARGEAAAENPQLPAQINIRMVTGYHIETARAVALSVGMLTEEEATQDSVVMEGKALWDAVGGPRGPDSGNFSKGANPADEEAGRGADQTPANMEAFEEKARSLKVLARATPAEKRLFVAGLKALPQDPLKTLAEDRAAGSMAPRREVACTGAHQRDAQTLKEATVGFAMGYGCSAARDASDVILTDGDLEAALRAVMWGRNVYNNVSRFLQFQVTVNISVLVTVLLGVLWFGESPMAAAQLLWINLLMDTFAAFALATEPPLPSVIKGRPHGGELMSGAVWRQIIGISCFNLAVMAVVICLGEVLYRDTKGRWQNTLDECLNTLDDTGCPLEDNDDYSWE